MRVAAAGCGGGEQGMVAATVADGAADTRGRDSGRDGWRGAAEEEEAKVAVQPAQRQE